LTEPLDYTTWTTEQHVAKACELLAEADRIGSPTIGSQAAQRMYDVQQITARAQVHADLAELKKPQPAATEPAPRQTRQRAGQNTDS
jgi:hypothetical protein